LALKKIVTIFIGFLLAFSFSGHSFAKEKESKKILTPEETQYLLDIGHSTEEIADLPVEIAKQLVSEKAEIKAKTHTIREIHELPAPGDYSTMGAIPTSQLKLWATAYKVTSDRSGYNKYYFYGNFDWNVRPWYTLVDALSIGFPESSGFFYQ